MWIPLAHPVREPGVPALQLHGGRVAKAVKLWASDLETFRYWWESKHRADTWDDPALELTDADLLKDLRREFVPTPDILAGSAFHKTLEEFTTGRRTSVYRTDAMYSRGKEYAFVFNADVKLARPISVETYFRLDVGRHFLTGKVDAITPAGLVDYKTTAKPLRLEKYLDSWQWRVYLQAHPRVGRMRYDVFRLSPFSPEEWEDGRTVLPYSVTDHGRLDVWRYPGMEDDIVGAVERFVDTTEPLGWRGR